MSELLKKLPFLLLVLLQASFLMAIIFERLTSIPILISLSAISILLIIAYKKAPIHQDKHLKEDYLAVAFVVVGAVATYYLNAYLNLGPVIAAGAVGTIASFVPILNKSNKLLREAPTSAYCGAFVGMSSPNIAGGFMFILFASIVAGLLLVFSKNFFRGYGGKLGTVAFGGVAIAYLLVFLLV